MTEEEPSNGQEPEPSKPFIHCEFNGELSAEMRVDIQKCSPIMLWGAARLLEQMAEDQWMSNQLAQMASQDRIIRATSIPQNHKRKGN